MQSHLEDDTNVLNLDHSHQTAAQSLTCSTVLSAYSLSNYQHMI